MVPGRSSPLENPLDDNDRLFCFLFHYNFELQGTPWQTLVGLLSKWESAGLLCHFLLGLSELQRCFCSQLSSPEAPRPETPRPPWKVTIASTSPSRCCSFLSQSLWPPPWALVQKASFQGPKYFWSFVFMGPGMGQSSVGHLCFFFFFFPFSWTTSWDCPKFQVVCCLLQIGTCQEHCQWLNNKSICHLPLCRKKTEFKELSPTWMEGPFNHTLH